MTITESEIKYNKWKEKPTFPNLEDREASIAKTFVERLTNADEFPMPLYPHQLEALLRVIYHGEINGKWESLLDIVTGGGKTIIMAGLVSYFWQARGVEKFLVIAPNTIVRERVRDDFEVRNPGFAYKDFPFFFNSHRKVPEKISCNVLRDKLDSASIRDANIIVANIHQLYEGRQSQSLEMLLSSDVVHSLVVFNDEAHNAAADQYREVLKLLKEKTVARVDLTATPYRLDKQDLDTYPPIYEYHVQQAIRDRVVKEIVVTKPDIESVKLTYEEWDDEDNKIRELSAEEMPWDQIEKELKRSGAVKFVTAKNARRQQLQIAESILDFQRKRVPLGIENKRQWEPLLLVVALSQKDAILVHESLMKRPFGYKTEELLLVHSKQDELENRKAFLLSRKGPEDLNKEDEQLWYDTRSVRVIIAVSMLREGWDVRNIAAICLFRKFSYQKKGDRIYTVYGPQIIGRGLRRIRPRSESDHLFVADHPAFDHDWLWQMLAATTYAKPLNPGDEITDENIKDIPDEQITSEDTTDDFDKGEQNGVLDIEDIIDSLPDAPSIVPIKDWQDHFKNLELGKRVSSAMQKITNVKSQKLGSKNTAHEIPDDLINIEDINEPTHANGAKLDRSTLIEIVTEELTTEPHQVLLSVFRQETASQLHKLTNALEWIIEDKFDVDGIEKIGEADLKTLKKMHFYLPQLMEEFRKPEIILGIIGEE